jgi:WD40 repeat protein
LATVSADRAAVGWNVTAASRPRAIDLLDHRSPVEAVAFGPHPGLLCAGCASGTVAVWRYRTGDR